ncbi:DUF4340 domain-containing protein [Paenibacillus radicis (ex Xue et al. 2023)]|uniref:DUF4340 domain-containing protein n=1 Tax=Paenibacillus radicis (ex Xue et al. 2023) TaxID=2972489 RepID=A0ABT1YG35_9BACL|nr:DUF4340 domain-containing protein [Paenibacillus radicis (ex Xue et al. 2023)]MCR8632136.1 DUF4340 domain-containing protein [Paenibacillus radicis (ex Xue et al. 2023)]
MKKKIIFLNAVVVVLIILLIIQFAIQNNKIEGTHAAETTVSTPAFSISSSESEVKKIKIVNTAGRFELVPTKGISGSESIDWVLETKPDFPVDPNLLNNIAGSATLTKFNLLDEHATNLEQFGLNPANAEVIVTLNNGREHTIRIGNPTPDQANFYVAINNEKAIYLMNSGIAKRLLVSSNELFDNKIPEINLKNLKSIEILKSGKLFLDLKAKQNKESVPASLPGAHLLPSNNLVMKYPVPDRDVYMEDFAKSTFGLPKGTFNLTNNTIKVLSIVDEKPLDMGHYGLSVPALELKIQDDKKDYHLMLGNASGDIIYAKFADKNYIFSINRESIHSILTFEPIQFIDRFLALINIVDCDQISIEASSSKFNVKINHKELPLASGQLTQREEQSGTLNGKMVEVDQLRKFYEMIIGLSFDAVIEPVEKPGNPLTTIKYTTKKGEKTVTFYTYNDNFYLVKVGDGPAQYLINEQAVDEAIMACNDIMSDRFIK